MASIAPSNASAYTSRLLGIVAVALEVLDVGAGREGAVAGAGEHHHANAVVAVQVYGDPAQFQPAVVVDGVALVGPVEGDGGYAVGAVE